MNDSNISPQETRFLGENVITTQDVRYPRNTVYKGSVGMVKDFGKDSGDPIVEFSYPDGTSFSCVVPYRYLKIDT